MIRFVTLVLGVLTGPTIPDLSTLPRARATLDATHHTLVIETVPIDLQTASSGMGMISLPVQQVVIPASGSIYSIHSAVIDGAGHELPRPFLHHVNLRDPNRRDLFLSSALHILAVSKETPALNVPPLVLGMPLERDQRVLITAMLNNPTETPYHGVRIRLTFGYRSTEGFWGGVFPMFRAYPWVVDVKFPLGTGPEGSLAFDLPPGRTVQSWEASPAVPGYILGLGGHVHDYATELSLEDATTGQVLWRQKPVNDSSGHVVEMPIK